jgi:Fe(3+) dicitrate transport protein
LPSLPACSSYAPVRQFSALLAALFILAPQLASAETEPAEDEPAEDESNEDESQEDNESSEETNDEESEAEQDKDPQLRETISVIGERSGPARVAGSAHQVDQEWLERFEHDDIHRVLAPVPGVYIRQEDGFGLRPNIGLRGASSDRSSKVTLMEDGILLAPAPYSAPAAYFFPMTTRMVGVEVFKGAAAIRHGPNTIGGAVNLQTRPIPESANAELDIAVGSYNTVKAHGHGGGRTPWGGFVLEGVHLGSDGFRQLDGGSNTGYVKDELMFKGRLNTPLGRPVLSAWDLKVGYGRERSKETYLGLSDPDFEATPNRRYAASQLGLMDWNRTQVELAWQLQTSKGFELRVVGYHHWLHRAWRKVGGFGDGPSISEVLAQPGAEANAPFFALLRGDADSVGEEQRLKVGTKDRTYHSYGGFATARWQAKFSKIESNLEVGVRLHADQIQHNDTRQYFLMQQGLLVAGGSEAEGTKNSIGRAVALAAHVHEDLRFGPFSIVPGLRVEVIRTSKDDPTSGDSSEATRATVLPGLGLHLQATPWLSVLAGVHRGFSPVSPGQDPEVEPEESWNAEAGARVAWRGTHVETVGFFNNYSNLTGNCTLSAGCGEDLLDQQFNAGQVFVYGVEAMLSQDFELPAGLRLSAGGSYTWTGSNFRTSFASASPVFGVVKVGDKLPYVPEHQGAASLALITPVSSVELALSAQGPMRDLPGQGEIADNLLIPAHASLDLAADLQILPNLAVYTSVNNLTNSSYMVSRRPYGARGNRPIHVMFGIKVSAEGKGPGLVQLVREDRAAAAELP